MANGVMLLKKQDIPPNIKNCILRHGVKSGKETDIPPTGANLVS